MEVLKGVATETALLHFDSLVDGLLWRGVFENREDNVAPLFTESQLQKLLAAVVVDVKASHLIDIHLVSPDEGMGCGFYFFIVLGFWFWFSELLDFSLSQFLNLQNIGLRLLDFLKPIKLKIVIKDRLSWTDFVLLLHLWLVQFILFMLSCVVVSLL